MSTMRPSKKMRTKESVYTMPSAEMWLDDNPSNKRWHTRRRLIPVTDSTAWGPPDQACARALLQQEVNDDNVGLIRTHHPAFHNAGELSVYLNTEREDGRRVWIIRDSIASSDYVYVCGLELHQLPDPQRQYEDENFVRPWQHDRLTRHINPRRMLSGEDLTNFRQMFPYSCGVRVYIGGAIQIVYPTEMHLRNSIKTGVPTGLNDSLICWDVLDAEPSTMHIPYGQDVAQYIEDFPPQYSTACVGLRLRYPNGKPMLTTVTHGFVRLPQVQHANPLKMVKQKTLDLFFWAKDALLNFRSPRHNPMIEHGYVSPKDIPTSNHPLGKAVYVTATREVIGTIAETYDVPDARRPYPFGYKHDLSLIKGSGPYDLDLPSMVTPPGYPVIDGWASVADALRGKPLFVSANLFMSQQRETHHGYAIDDATRREFKQAKMEALAEGVQYLWDNETLEQSVSLMWRTEPTVEKLIQDGRSKNSRGISPAIIEAFRNMRPSVVGFSGSVLCLGRTTDTTVKAICFQNFELPWPVYTTQSQPLGPRQPRIMAGFLLPKSITKYCTIEYEKPNDEGPQHGTFPRRKRASTDASRRSFTGPH
ncbi:hypothetical protein CGLO_05671 [Colletotrichum gloeosporioides Cg-14]|uniref:Uncharacterized protein n=1 Tax=Colletotrichum gloeosporioides (strain Cg-14) TaxID=1237896 RepID=T0KGF1_COLGC|nr:hypothetical protein CGLO_05671 [Colletotrichum gloeosporioides Cg-14]